MEEDEADIEEDEADIEEDEEESVWPFPPIVLCPTCMSAPSILSEGIL